MAARHARSLDSIREAYSHYRRASTFLYRWPAAEQALVLEELATAAYLTRAVDEALEVIERAGHFVEMERPDDLARRVIEFVKRAA